MKKREREERELFIVLATARRGRKNRLDFGAVLGSASSSPSRRKAPSMLIRRAATREGASVEQNPRKRGENGETSGRLAARRSPPPPPSRRWCCFISFSFCASFDTRSGARSAMLRHSVDQSRRQLSACHSKRRGSEEGARGAAHTAVALSVPTVFFFIFSPSVGSRRWPPRLPRRASPRCPRLSSLAIVALSDLLDGRKGRPEERACVQSFPHPSVSFFERGEKRAARESQATFFFSKKTSSSRPLQKII